jgi:uncharacterized lipoprotein YajG
MKNHITWKGIFVVLILSLLMFTGCAEKKSVVTSDATQKQEIAPAPAAKPSEQQDVTSKDKSEWREAASAFVPMPVIF